MSPFPAAIRAPRTPRAPSAASGFTLLELLVVIGLFALVAAMAYGGLISVLKTRADIEKQLDRTAAYQKAYWILRDDFQNGADRPVRGNSGELEYALKYTPLDREVDFTRAGWPNPLRLPRTTLRRLGYFWDSDKKTLVRRTWPVLDRAPRTRPVDTVLLTGVDDMRWRFLDANAEWQDHWPTSRALTQAAASAARTGAGGAANVLENSPEPPRAVELVLETSDWGRLRFLFSYGLPQHGAPANPASRFPPSNNVFSQQQPGTTPNPGAAPHGQVPPPDTGAVLP